MTGLPLKFKLEIPGNSRLFFKKINSFFRFVMENSRLQAIKIVDHHHKLAFLVN